MKQKYHQFYDIVNQPDFKDIQSTQNFSIENGADMEDRPLLSQEKNLRVIYSNHVPMFIGFLISGLIVFLFFRYL
jgi:hypothetical protein